MLACDFPHGVRCVARMDKERWCFEYWMILPYMSRAFSVEVTGTYAETNTTYDTHVSDIPPTLVGD
jgi:hypothetical protein